MTRQDRIATALCVMSAGLGVAKMQLPEGIQPWLYLPWTLGGVWFAWLIYKQTDWKLWQYRWWMRRLHYDWRRRRCFTNYIGGADEAYREIWQTSDGWVPACSWYVDMPVEGSTWRSAIAYPDPVTAHVAATIENWGR